jgi:hypothetical protein
MSLNSFKSLKIYPSSILLLYTPSDPDGDLSGGEQTGGALPEGRLMPLTIQLTARSTLLQSLLEAGAPEEKRPQNITASTRYLYSCERKMAKLLSGNPSRYTVRSGSLE